MKILLVDDNVLNQKVVTYYLNKNNYMVDSISSGATIIQKIKEENYSLILMDIMLPGMSGYEVTREIRNYELGQKTTKPVPIVAITANSMNSDRKKCIDTGMNDLLPKPFSIDDLMNIVKKYALTDE